MQHIAVNHLAIEITFELKGRVKTLLEIIYNYWSLCRLVHLRWLLWLRPIKDYVLKPAYVRTVVQKVKFIPNVKV